MVVRRGGGIEYTVRMRRSTRSILVIGGAGGSIFCGERLTLVKRRVMRSLARKESPCFVHGSLGVVKCHNELVGGIQTHLPWSDNDWSLSLQSEGASAVHAAQDALLARQPPHRRMVAVAMDSYHGPPLTSHGGRMPWGRRGISREQTEYPSPVRFDGEPDDRYKERLVRELTMFLERCGEQLGVILIEPQYGSSLRGLQWPRGVLAWFIAEAHRRSIYVCCDEVMCAMRHGEGGALFLSKAWQLQPDAIVFGKGFGGGIFPLAGAVVRNGKDDCSWHTHTFSAASPIIMAATLSVLEQVPMALPGIHTRAAACKRELHKLRFADGARVEYRGSGLLWGIDFPDSLSHDIQQACINHGVWPYFVAGGALITPPLDVEVDQLSLALRRLRQAVAECG